eukprot:181987-Chlamydomonas_euryale.AAC.2
MRWHSACACRQHLMRWRAARVVGQTRTCWHAASIGCQLLASDMGPEQRHKGPCIVVGVYSAEVVGAASVPLQAGWLTDVVACMPTGERSLHADRRARAQPAWLTYGRSLLGGSERQLRPNVAGSQLVLVQMADRCGSLHG